ncbi:MAG: helix-turn-helix domain-containing protein [Firmicutes bacterium]|nr:helix-turn-helix domain-containing protein [Bacillota bacterium]
MAERLITIQQFCDLLQISRSTIDRWRKDGLPFEKIGERGIRLPEETALKWVKERKSIKNK